MLNTPINRSNKRLLFGQNLLGYVFFYFGIAAILDYFLSVKILGLSFFVTIIPYSIVFFVFLKNIKIFNRINLVIYLFIVVLFLIIIAARALFYGEDIIGLIGGSRYILFVPIIMILLDMLDFKAIISEKKMFIYLFLILIVHAFNSLFYLIGLPFIEHVDVLADDYVEFSRFGGIMGGANVQGVFSSTIYMLMILSNWRMSLLKFLFLTLIAIIAVSPTVSRGGFLVILIPFFYYIIMNFKEGNLVIKITLLAFILAVTSLFISKVDFSKIEIVYSAFFDRIDQNDLSSGRIERLNYFWTLINEDFMRYLIGAPVILQSSGSNVISDNVFTLIPINFGVFFSLLFLIYIFFIISKNYDRKQSNINCFLLVVFIVSFTNNSIIWTAWSYCSIFGFFYLNFKNRLAGIQKYDAVKLY